MDEEFAEVMRTVTAELAAAYWRIRLPDRSTDPQVRLITGIAAGLLDGLPDDLAARVLRALGEAAADGGG